MSKTKEKPFKMSISKETFRKLILLEQERRKDDEADDQLWADADD